MMRVGRRFQRELERVFCHGTLSVNQRSSEGVAAATRFAECTLGF
jgi:hypothetical protein